jgi:hypothetical protein
MLFTKYDPGPCPVDDAPHTTCVAPGSGPITTVQFPMRDGVDTPPLVGAVVVPQLQGPVAPPLLAERIQATLPEGHVTTGTYRKKRAR